MTDLTPTLMELIKLEEKALVEQMSIPRQFLYKPRYSGQGTANEIVAAACYGLIVGPEMKREDSNK